MIECQMRLAVLFVLAIKYPPVFQGNLLDLHHYSSAGNLSLRNSYFEMRMYTTTHVILAHEPLC